MSEVKKKYQEDSYFESVMRGDASGGKDPYLEDDVDDLRFLGVRVTNLMRLVRVLMSFPFVIIVAAVHPGGRYSYARNIWFVRTMNVLIYVIPFIVVDFILARFQTFNLQILVCGVYLFVYLLPVAIAVFSKVDLFTASTSIEEGTFCFKPERRVHLTLANLYMVLGFVFEWGQHVLYALPVGVVSGQTQAKLEDYPPYLPFRFYFWLSVGSTFVCALILVLNAVLRGKAHYAFQKSKWVWFILFNVGSPMFVTIVTILFMGLRCNYDLDPPALNQDSSIHCYNAEHKVIARVALIALSTYLVQHTLLPSGTFKETMGDDTLHIMFVPVYLSAHYFLKAIFCAIYVFFYEDDVLRIFVLTFINLLLLWMNNYMKPCSIVWVNVMRNAMFLHASFSGILSLNYLFWPISAATKSLLISTLICTIVFTSIGVFAMYWYSNRTTDYLIATAFLDLDWQVSHGGVVHPRVLEPLISLTLSRSRKDLEIVKRYIGQLIWLISYPNKRVQFQAAWALSNLSLLEEDARLRINAANGTKTLLEWYVDMDDQVQLEVLAALGNLSLSFEVADDMVLKHKCVPFLLHIIGSRKAKHGQFALVAIANIVRKERYREVVIKNGGMQVLLGALMSHDYTKLKHSAVAIGNVVLSRSVSALEEMKGQGVLSRILKMAARNEADTQRELVSLLRNLTCYASMREALFKKGIIKVMERVKYSSYENVGEWAEEVLVVMNMYTLHRLDDKKRMLMETSSEGDDERMLTQMKPLSCNVLWGTWASKLDSVFQPIFMEMPPVVAQHINVQTGSTYVVDLSVGVPKRILTGWKKSIAFEISVPPHKGIVSQPNSRYRCSYTPSRGFVGTDMFTFNVLYGGLLETGTISITVNENSSAAAAAKTSSKARLAKRLKRDERRKKRGDAERKHGSDDDDDSEDDSDDGDDDEVSDDGDYRRRRGQRKMEAAADPDPDNFDIEMGLSPEKDDDQPFMFERNDSPIYRGANPNKGGDNKNSADTDSDPERKEKADDQTFMYERNDSPIYRRRKNKKDVKNVKGALFDDDDGDGDDDDDDGRPSYFGAFGAPPGDRDSRGSKGSGGGGSSSSTTNNKKSKQAKKEKKSKSSKAY